MVFKKGNIPWNKNKINCYSQITLNKISKALKNRKFTNEHKEKLRKQHKNNKTNDILKFIKENTNKYSCHCGCNKIIIIKRHHYWNGIPEYINHHGRIGIKHTNKSKLKNSISNSKPRPNQQGKNHWNWRNGASFKSYCSKFNNQLKEKIRNQYDRKCYICKITEDEQIKNQKENNKRSCKLHVHHIDSDKEQGCGGKGWKLVPLCRNCHVKQHRK